MYTLISDTNWQSISMISMDMNHLAGMGLYNSFICYDGNLKDQAICLQLLCIM